MVGAADRQHAAAGGRMIDATVPVPSPCVDICRLDARGLCVGCRRTIDEIMEWPHATEARRRELLRELAQRTTVAAPVKEA